MNAVGVDLNTVTQDLLEQLPGLDADSARAILEHRRKIGGFPNRQALYDVPGLSPATVRNVAGLLRVVGGTEPLDATAVHPDDYDIVRAVAAKRGVQPIDLLGQNLRDTPLEEFTTPETSRARLIAVLSTMMRGNAAGRTILKTRWRGDRRRARATSRRRGSMPVIADRDRISIGQRQAKATMAISMP